MTQEIRYGKLIGASLGPGDPELITGSGTGLNYGIDRDLYPRPLTSLMGVTLNF